MVIFSAHNKAWEQWKVFPSAAPKGASDNSSMPSMQYYMYWFIKFPVAEADAEGPRLASKS